MAYWFTSDTHFSHRNILKYCPRSRGQFLEPGELESGVISDASVQRMNRAMTDRWNAIVAPDDVVYHVGDFAMGPKRLIPEYRKHLNGRIYLIRGNHDPSADQMRQHGFEEVYESLTIQLDGLTLWLNHKPVRDRALWGSKADLQLCGHVHDSWSRQGNIINVGIDQSPEFRPMSLQELLCRDDLVKASVCNDCGTALEGPSCPKGHAYEHED